MSSTVTPVWVTQRAQLTPERIGLIYKGTSYTFQDIWEEAKNWANLLYQKGVRNGDHVGVWMNNDAKTVFIIHALQLIGARAILLNRKLQKDELYWQLDHSRATCLIHDGDRYDINGFQILEIPARENLLTLSERLDDSFLQKECALDEICSVMYTSGTTGEPKGVLQSYGNHWWSAAGSALNLGLSHDDVWLASVPLFHISGYSILMRSVIYGVPVILYDRFDEAAINRELIEGNVTIISVVTAMLSRLLHNLGGRTYSPKLRCMLLGGGPAPDPILMECKEKNIPVFQTYGMTETSSQIVTLAPEYALTKLGSAGKPLFPCQVKIDRSAGGSSENGEGEILVKGPNVTRGYWERPDANEQAFADGWFKTGDIGYLDEDGFLFVLDRRSDLIISGGENIYPAEIESVLLSHPSVREAGVVGQADPIWGQVPVAFVVLAQPEDEAAMISWLKAKMAAYKVPKKIMAVDHLPRNASNKLLRKELRTWL